MLVAAAARKAVVLYLAPLLVPVAAAVVQQILRQPMAVPAALVVAQQAQEPAGREIRLQQLHRKEMLAVIVLAEHLHILVQEAAAELRLRGLLEQDRVGGMAALAQHQRSAAHQLLMLVEVAGHLLHRAR